MTMTMTMTITTPLSSRDTYTHLHRDRDKVDMAGLFIFSYEQPFNYYILKHKTENI